MTTLRPSSASRIAMCLAGAALALVLTFILVPGAYAFVIGGPTAPGTSVGPTVIAPGASPGTLLAALSVPVNSTLNDYSATVVSAVFREAGGTLDFYYQVTNNTTATNCGTAGKPPCDAIARLTASVFDS